MNRFLTLLLFLTCSTFLSAQICMPDPIYQDSSAGVYPLPFNAETNPDGGIDKSACINSPYQFVFTIKIDSTIEFGGTEYPFDSLVVQAVNNMPIGFDYACSTPNCTFLGNSVECAVIQGTATSENAPGEYSIEIAGTAYTNIGGAPFPLEITFPNPLFFEGEYILTLLEEGNPDCFITDVEDLATPILGLSNTPNPFTGFTNVNIASQVTGDFQFSVHDIFGKQVYVNKVNLQEGQNTIEFDGSGLSAGLYVYSFSNGTAVVSNKMMIGK